MLQKALAEMSVANWPQSQQLLATRLELAEQHGNKRLNLFLLSVAAASGGYQELANHLWTEAQKAPLDEGAYRYFDLQLAPNDPRQTMLLDLENAWWNFNGWHQTSTTPNPASAPATVDWSWVIESTLSGSDAALEERYGRALESLGEESYLLWNFLALAYLQAGNVRTYDEMVSNRPYRPSPINLPPELGAVLEQGGYDRAITTLESGEWLTNDLLFQAESLPEASQGALSSDQWREKMVESFALLGLSQPLQAARDFQTIIAATSDPHRLALSLNALSLTFFRQGDYTQAEKVYAEFQAVLSRAPLEPSSPLGQEYQSWLTSVEAAPAEGEAFFSPFGTRSDWNQTATLESPQELNFWDTFQNALSRLADHDHAGSIALLQRLEIHFGSHLTPFERYLTALLFLAGAAMAGDHTEVQELAQEVNHLEQQAEFAVDLCKETADALRWAGFSKLAARIEGGAAARAYPLNPWEDVFPD